MRRLLAIALVLPACTEDATPTAVGVASSVQAGNTRAIARSRRIPPYRAMPVPAQPREIVSARHGFSRLDDGYLATGGEIANDSCTFELPRHRSAVS